MATYKVIQDVEAEDKIIGPLSLKQLIFAIVSAGFIFIAFRVVTLFGSIFLAIPFLPFIILFGALAAPISKTQPTDVWLTAQFHFLTKPKARLWDQNGLKQLVKITAPPKLEKNYTDGLSQGEVKSRLSALAKTLDSRGWAVKNVENVTLSYYQTYGSQTSDRLIGSTEIENPQQEEPIGADVLAESSPESQQMDGLINQEEEIRKQQIQLMMQRASVNYTKAVAPPAPVYNNSPTNLTAIQPQLSPAQTTPPILANTPPQLIPSQAPSNAQPSLEETEIINNIIKQKKVQQDVLQPNPHHKTIQTPEQLANTKPTVDSKKSINTKSQKDDINPAKSQEIFSKKTTFTKADKIDSTNALNLVSKQKPKQQNNKPQQDEVIIQLH